MRATLHFEDEDRTDLLCAVHATELAVALRDVQRLLREYWKHADLEGLAADQLIHKIWDEFHDIAGPVLEATE